MLKPGAKKSYPCTIVTKNDNMDPNKPHTLGLENDPEIQEIQTIIKCLEEKALDHSSKAEEASSAAECLI